MICFFDIIVVKGDVYFVKGDINIVKWYYFIYDFKGSINVMGGINFVKGNIV